MPFAPLAALLAVTLAGPADVASLTAAADAVVRGRVARIASAWVDGTPQSGLIFTTVELEPLEWWKGEPVAGRVLVRVPGGSVGELGQLSQGAATFAAGEEVVVFLRKLAPQAYAVERWSLGKFTVKPLSGRALRSRDGVVCASCRPGEPDEFALDDLRARVRQAVGK